MRSVEEAIANSQKGCSQNQQDVSPGLSAEPKNSLETFLLVAYVNSDFNVSGDMLASRAKRAGLCLSITSMTLYDRKRDEFELGQRTSYSLLPHQAFE